MASPGLPGVISLDPPSISTGDSNGHTPVSSSLDQDHEDGIMPIAIVGMACRFPGGSTSPEQLWEMLANKRSGWSKVPAARFTQDSFQHPSASVGGTVNRSRVN